jgi:hypothetical protein
MMKHLNGGVKKGALTAEQAQAKFDAWMKAKEAKITSKISGLAAEAAKKVKEAANAEVAVKNAKAEALAAKKAEAAAKAAAAAAEAAAAAGKPFNPVAEESEVIIEDESQEFENMSAADMKEISDEVNANPKTEDEYVKEVVSSILARAKTVAESGGYQASVIYNSYNIPWTTQYKRSVVSKLQALGYTVEYLYAGADLNSDFGITLKW